MNKEQACKFLGVSPRTLDKYIKLGEVSVKYVKGKTRSVADFDREELRRFKHKLEEPTHRPAVEPPESRALALRSPQNLANPAAEPVRGSQRSAGFEPALALLLPHKPSLSLEEAALLFSTSAYRLEQAIRAGELQAARIGPRGTYVVLRETVEAWVRGAVLGSE